MQESSQHALQGIWELALEILKDCPSFKNGPLEGGVKLSQEKDCYRLEVAVSFPCQSDRSASPVMISSPF